MGKYQDIDYFIDKILAESKVSKMSLNIYHGKGDGPKIRRENLRFYLEKMKDLNPSRLFVGEAPGRWGCLQTGIPFTDINTLIENDFFKEIRENNEKGINLTEKTSETVWECLKQLQDKDLKLPLLWNIYPFHPSNVTDECTLPESRPNRTSNVKERQQLGMKILFDLLKCFDSIKEIYPVGEKSEETLRMMFPLVLKAESCIVRIPYINHPSRKPEEFIKKFDNTYQISPKIPEELKNFIKK